VTRRVVFALGEAHGLGAAVAARLGVPLAPQEFRAFDGGEHKTRPLVGVRRAEVVVVAPLDGGGAASANDELCRLLFFVAALKQSGADTVTVVAPYLCYSRKDRQTKARDPVTTRAVAQVLEAVGVDRVVTVDVHDLAAFQNAFRCATDHIEATPVFVAHAGARWADDDLVVVSPDIGGVKRADRLRDRLVVARGRPVELAFCEKFRSAGQVSGRQDVLGDVEGRVAVVLDDIIATGTTMLRVAGALRERGAIAVHLVATHGLFAPAARALFHAPEVSSVVVTDSVPARAALAADAPVPLVVLGLGDLLAEAVARILDGGSLSALLAQE
jgi:ribose-phosphate pyrophosphokinase